MHTTSIKDLHPITHHSRHIHSIKHVAGTLCIHYCTCTAYVYVQLYVHLIVHVYCVYMNIHYIVHIQQSPSCISTMYMYN